MPGRLLRILTAPERGAPLQDHERIEAIAGQGLAGDRYALGRGTFSGRFEVAPGARELSLIDSTAVARANTRLGTAFDAAAFRRNLVTADLDLVALLGATLRAGAVEIELLGRCPPCGYLSRLIGADARQGLKGIGGVRARIRRGGTLCVDQPVTLLR